MIGYYKGNEKFYRQQPIIFCLILNFLIMRPFAITESKNTWCGWIDGVKVYGYKDDNGFYYWFKSRATADKYAIKYGKYLHYATLQGEYHERATIYNTYMRVEYVHNNSNK